MRPTPKPTSIAIGPAILMVLALFGCQSPSNQTAPNAPLVVPQTTPSPTHPPQPAPNATQATSARPIFRSPNLVSQVSSGGPRGLQPITFVVKAAEETVEAANISILTDKGKPAGTGSTNDWGEFKTSLSPGRYTVVIQWQGKKTVSTVQIDANTQEVPLSLTLPAPKS